MLVFSSGCIIELLTLRKRDERYILLRQEVLNVSEIERIQNILEFSEYLTKYFIYEIHKVARSILWFYFTQLKL